MKIAAVLFAGALAFTTWSLHASSNDLPPGWSLAGEAPQLYSASVDHDDSPSGKGSVVLRRAETSHPYGEARMMHTLPVAAYAGKKIRLTMHLRPQAENGTVLLQADKNTYMQGLDPGDAWTEHVTVISLPRTIKQFQAGILLKGPGAVKVDRIEVEVLGDAPANLAHLDIELPRIPARLRQ